MSEISVFSDYIARITRDVIKDLHVLSDAQLNQPLPIPDANTIFAIGTHYVGMAEFWTLTLVGGQPTQRVRSAEFVASGRGSDLIARLERYRANAHTLLADLPPGRLDEIALPPAEFAQTGGFKDQTFTCRDCLMHVVEHCATHLGHIQLSKDMLLARAAETVSLDHVQVAIPVGSIDAARAFYGGVLRLHELEKPASLAGRGGAWFSLTQGQQLHLGEAENFTPARKAHPAFMLQDLSATLARCSENGETQPPLPGYIRAFVQDPFGNRIELMQKL